uniref:Uncharacterized protein n=1 Tax=Lepeophtheirus salmonis TaxID=72036 RepID=A0A0K2UNJ7_LEPSM
MKGFVVFVLNFLMEVQIEHCLAFTSSTYSPFMKLSHKIDEGTASILDYDTTDCLPAATNRFKLYVNLEAKRLSEYAKVYSASSSNVSALIDKFRHFHLTKSTHKKEILHRLDSGKVFRVLKSRRIKLKRDHFFK